MTVGEKTECLECSQLPLEALARLHLVNIEAIVGATLVPPNV